jgi:hypothetical protein
MTTSHSTSDAPPDRARMQKLERWICFLLQMHPVTPATLVSIGWFRRDRKARKCLLRLARSGRIAVVGTIRDGPGRPEHVYCCWRPEAEDLQHQVRLTELFLRLDAGTINRGPSVSDRTIRPDAELWIKGQPYYLELDRGERKAAALVQRLSAYESCPHPSLWVCLGPERAEWFRQQAGQLRAPALFACLYEAQAGPHRPIWKDIAGNVITLPQEQQ